jgi:hypothetical protein
MVFPAVADGSGVLSGMNRLDLAVETARNRQNGRGLTRFLGQTGFSIHAAAGATYDLHYCLPYFVALLINPRLEAADCHGPSAGCWC